MEEHFCSVGAIYYEVQCTNTPLVGKRNEEIVAERESKVIAVANDALGIFVATSTKLRTYIQNSLFSI